MTIQYGYKGTNCMGIYLIYQVIYCRRTQKSDWNINFKNTSLWHMFCL